MADSFCGPSNALQNFQKHTSVDRTLQQDRLTSRQSPSQAFRSQNSNAGTQDPEFDAFEAGISVPPLPDIQHTQFNHVPHHIPDFPRTEKPGWASDFQKLQLSDPAHSASPQFQIESPRHMGPRGWQSEFMHQQRFSPPQQQQQQQQMSQAPAVRSNYSNNFGFANGGMAHGISPLSGNAQSLTHQTKPEDVFDETAFEAAFDQARAEIEMQENDITQDHEQKNLEDEEQLKIGSDTIPHVERSDAVNPNENSDELARTAGQLLDSVSHDQSQKFKDSNFLALMRRIRDREVRVEGDEFRDALQPLHPGGKFYPEV